MVKKRHIKMYPKNAYENTQRPMQPAMNITKLFIKPEHQNLLAAILLTTSYTKLTEQLVPGT